MMLSIIDAFLLPRKQQNNSTHVRADGLKESGVLGVETGMVPDLFVLFRARVDSGMGAADVVEAADRADDEDFACATAGLVDSALAPRRRWLLEMILLLLFPPPERRRRGRTDATTTKVERNGRRRGCRSMKEEVK
jgi:hypothetical protein